MVPLFSFNNVHSSTRLHRSFDIVYMEYDMSVDNIRVHVLQICAWSVVDFELLKSKGCRFDVEISV